MPDSLRDLYAELDEALSAWGEVEVALLRHYIAYRRLVNVASVIFRPKHEAILVHLRLDPDSVALEEGFTRDMRGIGHLGTGAPGALPVLLGTCTTTSAGAAIGADAGLACGPLAWTCVPAGAAGGAWVGGEPGTMTDEQLDEWGSGIGRTT
ncbi:hypothetical protein [Streptomyces zaomyceticus]|uniref:hypothetical protein n=1 Tax=Streptomyces zaomyceticus TaxID=68286 RepID=UPI0036779F51